MPNQSIEELPNIGPKLAESLRAVGIFTSDELSRIGSVKAALLVAAQRPEDSPCRSMLCALEGAVRSVPLAFDPQVRAGSALERI